MRHLGRLDWSAGFLDRQSTSYFRARQMKKAKNASPTGSSVRRWQKVIYHHPNLTQVLMKLLGGFFGSHLPKWLPSSLVHSMFIPKLDCTGTLPLNTMKWECVEDALREFAFPLFPTHQLYFCIIETWLIFKLIYFNSSFFHMTPKKV